MDIDGAYGHDLLPVPAGELANQHGDEGFELGHLFLVIVLHGILVAFLQPGKCHAHLCGPPDLSAGQGHLGHQESLSKAITRTVSQTSPVPTQHGLRMSFCGGRTPLPSLFHQHCLFEHMPLRAWRCEVGTTQVGKVLSALGKHIIWLRTTKGSCWSMPVAFRNWYTDLSAFASQATASFLCLGG